MTKLKHQYRFGRFWFDEARRDLQRDGVPVRARTQALDLLAALLAKPGALVSKDELMNAAWPGLHVEEGNISVQVHYLRQLLQDAEKPYQWIATEPGRGYRFIGTLEAEPNPPGHGIVQMVNPLDGTLPDAPGPLIGRERELATLQAHMPRHRLVTVTGPGGMGKTRLAIEFAREQATDPLNKTLFLGLEGLRQKDQISFRLAARLGVQPSEDPQLAQVLADALQKQGCLIIFDNCEHVLSEVAALARTILQHAPRVSILATSREPLELQDEFVFALGPLHCPGSAVLLSTREIETYNAVRLFVEKARAIDPAFRLNDATASDVAAICRRMEGIPLALQLAAARLRDITLPQLVTDISRPNGLPSAASPSVPSRHRTVEATIAWSVALLCETERAALRRLSIFPAGFTTECARAVIARDVIDVDDIAGLVGSLCNKSLLMMSSARCDQQRFRLLESTRDFGLGMLAQAGETAAFERALALHMVSRFGRARDAWPDTKANDWSAAFEPDIETLRATLEWAFSPDGDHAIAAALAARLRALFSDRLISQREFLAAIGPVLQSVGAPMPRQDEGWILFSASYDLASGHERSIGKTAAALESFRATGDKALIGVSAARAAVLVALQAGATTPNPFLDEALAILPLVPNNRYRSAILLNVATSFAIGAGSENLQLALQHFEQALPIAHAFNDMAQIALIGANLAELEAKLGNYGAAIERATELAEQSRSRRDLHRLSHNLLNLMQYNLLANRLRAARDLAAEAIQLLIDFEDAHWGADYGGRFAMLAARLGNWRQAAKLAGFSDQYYVSHRKERQTVDQRVWDKLAAAFDDAADTEILQKSERLALMQQGAGMSLRDALMTSRRLLETQCEVLAC